MRLYGIVLFYVMIITAFTVYWGSYFDEYFHYKGDESTFFVKILVGVNYLLLVLAMTTYRKISLLFLGLSPLLNALVAFVLAIFVLLGGSISGIPKHTFYVFAPVFILSSLMSLFLYYRRFKTT